MAATLFHHARGSSHETTSTWQPGVPQLVGLRDEHAAVAVGGAARPAGVLPGNTGAFARRRPGGLLPTGLLGLLPLQAAQQDADATPFGERWTVSLAPSVRTLLDCRERATAATAWPPRPLGLLDPDGSLPGARQEKQVLDAAFARAKPEYLIGNDATHSRLMPLLAQATHWHVSAHAEHDPTDPSQSGLLLAGGDKLRLRDLSGAQLPRLRLAFLLACETGLAGVLDLPEEFLGLPAGLVAAGAAAVTASLWPVFDHTSICWRLVSTPSCSMSRDMSGFRSAAALKAAQRFLRTVRCGTLRQVITDGSYEGPDRILSTIADFSPADRSWPNPSA